MHNFKKVLKTFLVLVVCVALLAALDLALYPCTFMRNDVHAVVTQQFDDIIVGTSHGKMDIDPEVMQEVTLLFAKLTAQHLTGLPLEVLGNLSARDAIVLKNRVYRFFYMSV